MSKYLQITNIPSPIYDLQYSIHLQTPIIKISHCLGSSLVSFIFFNLLMSLGLSIDRVLFGCIEQNIFLCGIDYLSTDLISWFRLRPISWFWTSILFSWCSYMCTCSYVYECIYLRLYHLSRTYSDMVRVMNVYPIHFYYSDIRTWRLCHVRVMNIYLYYMSLLVLYLYAYVTH